MVLASCGAKQTQCVISYDSKFCCVGYRKIGVLHLRWQ